MKYDVVIAGGGFAGAYCAKVLGRALGRDGIKRVALIAERNVLVFQPMLAEVVGSSLAPADVVNPLREFCRGVNVLQGNIQKITWENKQLVLDGGRFTRNHVLEFDHLVLALGGVILAVFKLNLPRWVSSVVSWQATQAAFTSAGSVMVAFSMAGLALPLTRVRVSFNARASVWARLPRLESPR